MIGTKAPASHTGAEFRVVADQAPVALLVVRTANGVIEYCNHAADQLFGRSEMVGKKVEVLGSTVELTELIETAQTGEAVHSDVPLTRPVANGSAWAAVAARTITWENDQAVLLSLMEITNRKSLEAELRASVESLATSNADLEQFAYIASHDLQEPLRMISSYMTLLKQRYQGKLDGDAEDFISYAVDGATRLQQMINDLLVFSRVQTRGKELAPTEAEAAYGNALENLAYSMEEERAEITHEPLPLVRADATQLTMLFQNLLSNAIKFHGDETPRIHVSVEPTDGYYKFCVQDNGIGIDPQFFDKIFMIFRRLHTREEYPGTGIGLAVCKRIVSRHGGQIWVESPDGQGSRFYFTLLRGDGKE